MVSPRSDRRRALWLAGTLIGVAATILRVPLGAAAADPGGGTFELVARHSGKCLDIEGASTDDLARAIQWDCHGGPNQQWTFQAIGGGYYTLIARHSGKVLDVFGQSTADLATVGQYSANGGANQQWSVQPVGGGYYTLTARHSGKLLDVLGVSTASGAAVIQYAANGGDNQQWLIRGLSDTQPPPSSPDIVRFLEQATFGPTPQLIEHVRSVGFEQFLAEQFAVPASSYPTLPLYPTTRDTAACPNNSTCQRDNYTTYPLQNRFFVNAVYGEDQLRQRVAFALHQILVVSGVDITQPSWMTPYLQTLDRNAFGNYRQLLYEITLNPAMGNYLDVNGNTRTRPNENYARELLQLFTIGTVALNHDGTPQQDGTGVPVATYDQTTINNFARVFTGWRLAPGAAGIPNYLDPMVANEAQHDTAVKILLNGAAVPAGQNTAADLNAAIDNIFSHPNVGPFIGKQLIQHLVTSNPTPGYVARVAAAFDAGTGGVRGDLKSVIRAILLDPEARGDFKTDAAYGRLRHPAQFIAGLLRAFNARSADGGGQSDGYLNPQSVAMGMDVFRPPSVFSYFSPNSVVPGTNGVRGPEFGILSTSTALQRANFVNTIVFSTIATGANAPAGSSLDLSALQAQAGNPATLVDSLNALLLHGSMSPEMRSSIVGAVSAVAAANPLKRARTAVYLVASSSQYQVER
jgi:uncharacterized protein (DUF1800 family)